MYLSRVTFFVIAIAMVVCRHRLQGDAEMTKNVAARTEQVDEVDGMDEDEELEEKLVVCQRCHKLRFYGSVTESLRPGFSDSDLLTPQRFLVGALCYDPLIW